MYRELIKKLLEWKNNPDKKPLILEGARQVGKTWILEEFGKKYFTNYLYLNFESNYNLKPVFSKNLVIERIIKDLEQLFKIKINNKNTLLIFDEIQEDSNALTSLKYFCENKIKYNVVTAGSLLGIKTMDKGSFPSGKVDFLKMYPLIFREFLMANGENSLVDYFNDIDSIENVTLPILEKAIDYMYEYLLIGGMPKVVDNWVINKKIDLVETDIQTIINSCTNSISNYSKDVPRTLKIFNNIGNIFHKETKRFTYRSLDSNARSRDYESPLLWIIAAHIFYKVNWNSVSGIPKNIYDDFDIFKIFLFDIGVLRCLVRMPNDFFYNKDPELVTFKGKFFENYVLNSLIYQFSIEDIPSYWSQSKPPYEIDFLIQYRGLLIPIEVKYSTNVKSLSFKFFNEKFKPKLRVRYSMNNLSLDGNILNIPLCLVDWTQKFIDLAIEQLKLK